MVTGKEMEDHCGEVELGETYVTQEPVDYVIYYLWRMKEHNCAMRMISNSDQLLADDTCNQNMRRSKKNGEDVAKKFK